MSQYIITRDTIESGNLNKSIGTHLTFRYQEISWHSGIQIDHLVPKAIMKDFPKFKILEANVNKVALHIHCHKIKTKENQAYFFKPWIKLKKSTNNSNSIAFILFMNDKSPAQGYLQNLEALFSSEYTKRIHLIINKMKNL